MLLLVLLLAALLELPCELGRLLLGVGEGGVEGALLQLKLSDLLLLLSKPLLSCGRPLVGAGGEGAVEGLLLGALLEAGAGEGWALGAAVVLGEVRMPEVRMPSCLAEPTRGRGARGGLPWHGGTLGMAATKGRRRTEKFSSPYPTWKRRVRAPQGHGRAGAEAITRGPAPERGRNTSRKVAPASTTRVAVTQLLRFTAFTRHVLYYMVKIRKLRVSTCSESWGGAERQRNVSRCLRIPCEYHTLCADS